MSRYKIILLNQSIMHNRNTISKDRYVMMPFIRGQCHISAHALPVHNYFRLSLWSSNGTGIFGQKLKLLFTFILCTAVVRIKKELFNTFHHLRNQLIDTSV